LRSRYLVEMNFIGAIPFILRIAGYTGRCLPMIPPSYDYLGFVSLGFQMKHKYTTYDDLLRIALAECDSFTLVWRFGELEASGRELEQVLEPWLLEEYSSYSWPGTQTSQRACVRKYRVCAESTDALRCVDSVFDLLYPRYPEDLAFYTDHRVRFGSIAHEGDAWFEP
jgi:hypothetical protein